MHFNLGMLHLPAATTLALVSVLVAAGIADAADRNAALMQAFIDSAEHQHHVREILLMNESVLAPDCEEPKIRKIDSALPVQKISFTEEGQPPTTGAWIEIWNVDVCGDVKRRSAIFLVKDGKFHGVPYVPGETKTSPQLFSDTMRLAVLSVDSDFRAQSGKKCEERFILTDTVLTRPLTPFGQLPDDVSEQVGQDVLVLWEEEWHFRGCGLTSVLDVTFTNMGAAGTDFSVHVKDSPAAP